jgi:hypothetical protein
MIKRVSSMLLNLAVAEEQPKYDMWSLETA